MESLKSLGFAAILGFAYWGPVPLALALLEVPIWTSLGWF